MPLWKGWDEYEVRGNQANANTSELLRNSGIPNMAGFTAINASAVAKSESVKSHPGPSRRTNSVSSVKRNQTPKTVASDYLGRSDPNGNGAGVKDNNGPLHGPGTKKSAGRGKKRVGNSASETSVKRRKTSDLADSMPISKHASQPRRKPGGNSSAEKQPDSISWAVPNVANETATAGAINAIGAPHMIGSDAALQSSIHSATVFASSTSMDSFQAAKTSIDAVRSSAGHSTTVYQSARTLGNLHTVVQATQQSNISTSESRTATDVEMNARVLRPRNNNVACTNEGAQASSTLGSSPKNVPNAMKQPQWMERPSKSRVSQPSKDILQPKSVKLICEHGEDFIGDDDNDLIEALETVRAIETTIPLKRKNQEVSAKKMQLPVSATSVKASKTLTNNLEPSKRKITPILTLDDEFMELAEEEEAELLDLAEDVDEATAHRSPTPPHRNKKLNLREVNAHEDYGGALFSDADRRLLDKLKAAKESQMKPILRKPIPSAILDRSPLFGATNTTLLRTCFRLGEALNIGSRAVRTNQNILLELYARVTSSHREDRKQHFVFGDLYHDHPPYLEGWSELWLQSRLWDLDGKAFLAAEERCGVMCRVVGRMRRDGDGNRNGKAVGRVKCRLEVLSIWEAQWEDVEFVAGIYAKDFEVSEE